MADWLELGRISIKVEVEMNFRRLAACNLVLVKPFLGRRVHLFPWCSLDGFEKNCAYVGFLGLHVCRSNPCRV